MIVALARRWYLVLLFTLAAGIGYAQTATQQEITVFLKNGKVVRGMTTLSMFEGHLTVEHDQFNQTPIPYSDIYQITFGTVPEGIKRQIKAEKPKKVVAPFEVQERGFFTVAHVGFLPQGGGYETGAGGMTLSIIHGYTFRPYFKVGFGIGLDHYGYNNITAVPFFASVQGFMNRKRWSPLYFLNAGLSPAWVNLDGFTSNERANGGLMIHPGLGYRYSTGKVGVSFSLGYKVQKAQLAYSWEDWGGGMIEVEEKRILRRLSVSVGVHF